MDALATRAHTVMQQNRRRSGATQYTIPSPELYPFQWLWDSCFHAFIYTALGESDSAARELRAALSHQFVSGMLPHIIYWDKADMTSNWGREMRGDIISTSWGTDSTSAITQPPLIARAALETSIQARDTTFLEDIFPALRGYFTYLAQERTDSQTGLLYIINPDESGEDNSPRYDALLGLPAQHSAQEHLDKRIDLIDKNRECNYQTQTCMHEYFAVVDVGFNAIYYDGLVAMAQIAQQLHKQAAQLYYTNLAAITVQRMRDHLQEDDIMLSYDCNNGQLIPVRTWNIFMPLYAGLLTQEDAQKLVHDHLLNTDTFCAPHGIRSTAKDEPSYDATGGFWRGPIWMGVHWFVYHGLLRYGFTKEAADLASKSKTLIERGGFREQYNPETGEGLGAHDFTWGALVCTFTLTQDQQ